MRFADSARRLAHLASAALGWRPGEYWQSTPAELMTALGLDDDGRAPPATTDMLGRLMELYPDEP